jgi:hypothetical protein
MRFSRALAIIGGVVLPLAETFRRARQLGDPAMWPFWLDDWIIGAFLLYGFWRTRDPGTNGRPILAAAWGFACGMAYTSFFAQLAMLHFPDPSGVPSSAIAAIKGMMLAVALAALAGATRGHHRSNPE